MKLTKCPNGHFYDADKHPECPYCNGGLEAGSAIAQPGTAAEVDLAAPKDPVAGWLVAVRRGIVVYDPQDNNWCALPGSSNELCTLNGKSLIEKMPLTAGDTFAVGGAQLRFVPLCGPEFNWNAAPKERK